MVTSVRKGISLGPSGKGISLAPRRGLQLRPVWEKKEESAPLWYPTEIPGHRDYIPVLVMISGWRGVGKTLTETMLGLIQKARYQEAGLHHWKLMSNYPVVGADIVDPKIVDQLATFDPRMKNATVLVDELPSYFPNRKSLRGVHVDFSTFIQQVRKRSIEIIFTAQVPIRVDVQITEQVDWYIIPERFGPRGRFLRLYWFDFKGQFMGQGHKYWPPKKEEADVVKIYGPLDSIYGKYPTGQVIAPQWSGYRDAIIEQDDWDESLFVDGAPVGGRPMPEKTVIEQIPDLMNRPVEPPRNLEEFIFQLPKAVDIKQIWTDAKVFFPKGATYKMLRVELRAKGYQVPDNGYQAVRE